MEKSTTLTPSELLGQMLPRAKARFGTDAEWANAGGLPKETLSRLKRKNSCDLRTVAALARAVGCTLKVVSAGPHSGPEHMPESFDRNLESKLLDLAASGNVDPDDWRASGPSFFMGGLAALLASARGFDRTRYLRLAETIHPGVSTPEVFGMWLDRAPVKPTRFLPMARRRKNVSA